MAETTKKTNSKRTKSKYPSRLEIDNGFYLDFEGFGKSKEGYQPDPALCGYRIGGKGPVKFIVFTRALKWAAIDSGIEFQKDRHIFYHWLVDGQLRNRKLFAFSEHEDYMLRKMSQPKGALLKRRAKPLKRYRNVRQILEKAYKGKTPAGFGNSLIEFCGLADVPVRKDYGKGQVTKWLREVKKYSCRKEDTKKGPGWKSAPQSARDSWQKILNHNEDDVKCMYDLLSRVSALK